MLIPSRKKMACFASQATNINFSESLNSKLFSTESVYKLQQTGLQQMESPGLEALRADLYIMCHKQFERHNSLTFFADNFL